LGKLIINLAIPIDILIDATLYDQASPVVKGAIAIVVAEYVKVGLLVNKLVRVVVEPETGVEQRPGGDNPGGVFTQTLFEHPPVMF